MSRSYRHTPILKSARDLSNREFKVEAHQKFRRESKQALNKDLNAYDDADGVYGPVPTPVYPHHMRDVSQIWCSKQDGRCKEFGDFWGKQAADIAQDMVIRPHYTMKNAERDLWWAKRWWRRFFLK